MTRVPTFLCILAIVALTFVAYANSFGNTFVFDDISQIKENAVIKDIRNIPKAFAYHLTYFSEDQRKEGKFYRPLQTVTLMVDRLLWGPEPVGYHITNTLLHAAVAALLFAWVLGITGLRPVAFAVAAIYAVHPVHTEAVTYMSGRADSLCTVFLLLILLCQRQFWRAASKPARAGWYAVMLVFFVCALLSKEFAIVFPFLLMLHEYCLRGDSGYTPVWNRRFLFYAPLFLVTGGWFLLKNTIVTTETMVVHATSLATRLTSLPRIIYDYVRLSVVPTDLHMEYKLPFPRSVFQGGYFEPFLFVIPLCGAIVYAWRRGRRDAASRTVFFGLAWFLLGLLPYMNILFQLNAPFAEHWLYVPEMGFLLAVVLLIYRAVAGRVWLRRAAAGACLAVLIVYTAMTARQNAVWKDALTFYTYTLRYAPFSSTVHNNIAIEYIRMGDLAKGEAFLKRALELDPDYETAKDNLAKLAIDMRRRGLR